MNQSNEPSAWYLCPYNHEAIFIYIIRAFIIALGIAAFGAGFSLTVFIIMLEWEKQEQLWDTKVAVIGGTLILHVVLPIASVIFILQFIPTRLPDIFCVIDDAWTDISINSSMENPTGRHDITNNTFIDIELDVCEGNTRLPDPNEPIENAFTSRKTTRSQAKSEFVATSNVEENVASFSPRENNENILNTEVFQSTSTRYSSNFEPSRKCAFGCVGIIIIICSSVLPLIADINLHNRQAHNATFLNDTNWQHRIDARLVAYCFEMFLTPVALVYLLYIYYSCVLKSDRITRSVLIDGDLDYAIKQIKELSLNVSRLQKTSKQRLQLVYAHWYASIYVFCCMSFGLAYLWYVRTWASAISNDFFFKFLGHFLAYGGLVCVMWKTNVIIDRMKETVLLVGSSGHPRIRNINLHDREKALFALAVERCQLYAFLYYRKVSLPGVLVAILPGAASLLLRYVNRRLHLYELFSDKV